MAKKEVLIRCATIDDVLEKARNMLTSQIENMEGDIVEFSVGDYGYDVGVSIDIIAVDKKK